MQTLVTDTAHETWMWRTL